MTTRALIAAAACAVAACQTAATPARLDARQVTVRADTGWQDTGWSLQKGQTFSALVVSAQIQDQRTPINDGNGLDYVCGSAGCCEPLPSARRSSLIASIGASTFPIGDGGTFTAADTGPLRLRINDCDEGLFDNSGTMTIQLSP